MLPTINIKDLGQYEYGACWDYQKSLFSKILENKHQNWPSKNTLLLVEHPHVYTLGKHGKKENLLITDQWLNEIGASFYEIDRGGDITYHGPGQLVVYPVFDLENFGIRTREFVYRLEESIIRLMQDFEIKASRMKGAAGVWIDANLPTARKICSIGIKSSRGATMHGIALNINTDLKFFSYINPCGFIDKGMTSMQVELKKTKINFEIVKNQLVEEISGVFEAEILKIPTT